MLVVSERILRLSVVDRLSQNRKLFRPDGEIVRVSPPGAVARSCNLATGGRVQADGVRRGLLLAAHACRAGVRTKARINMDPTGEPGGARLSEEGRTGPGGKPSSQQSPCGSVVGPRQ